jgi:thioesterase domain-containing protein
MPYLSGRLRTWLIRPPPYAIRPDLYGRISRRAGRRYKAQPYSGPIVVFCGKGQTEVHKANWQALAQGGLTVSETPADHSSIVRPPYSEILAGHIDACLQSVRDS